MLGSRRRWAAVGIGNKGEGNASEQESKRRKDNVVEMVARAAEGKEEGGGGE